ncbi:hypothetical protein HanRHA438_Chr02g0054221 [Helianthus annuus]|uniref:Uncharacterized protein n=1 Tax=Helianthus annuus TaxID=4232 RepID=A0A9K3P029_HELAN|nr:hypothetical protein HanXRQr2_Chr02g0052941 [Helianthus annuus]KAJ0938836.1 hypothetical protein HanRHA438_Chr02g0054221 [Helianthus annuus]
MRTTSEVVLPTGTLKRLSSVEERSPQYQEQGASMNEFWDSVPKSCIGTTTAGGDSDDPSNSGDDSKYQELTRRVENLENSVAEIKDMVQQLLKAQKAQSTAAPAQAPAQPAPAANELWNMLQPLLERQKQMADQQHDIHVQKLTNMVESRFKGTQADIKAIKAHIQSASGKIPPTVLFMNEPFPDNAKKGKKIKWKKKGINDGIYIEPEKNSQTKAAVLTHTTPPHTTTTTATPSSSSSSVITAPKPNSPSKTATPPSPPAKKQKTADVTTSAVITTVVETPVVSTAVSQSLITTQTTAITTPAQKQKTSADISVVVMTTAVGTPVVSSTVSQPSTTALTIPTSQPKSLSSTKLYTRKRKVTQATEDKYDPNAAKYPMELEAVKSEMRQFYTEDDPSNRRFPSPIGFIVPEDIDEYLELKARQAKIRAKIECEGQSDEAISEKLEFLLTKVKQMEDFAHELSKEKVDQ